MAKKPAQNPVLNDNYFPFVLLLPLLLLPPFFRGLFFDTESFVAYMYASALLITYVIYKKEYLRISFSVMELAFIGFVAVWFLAIFGAYDIREAVGDSLRNLNYLVIFFLIIGLATSLKKMTLVMWAFFIAGVGVALAGIGTAYGTFSFNGAYVDGLINSTLQYHNAAAIYLMACGIIGLYLTASFEKLPHRYLISGANFLVLITAFGAGSRGAMLMGPIAYVLYLVGIPKGLRIKSILSLLSILIAVALLSTRILDFGAGGIGWLFLLIGILLASLIHFGLEKGMDQFSLKIDPKKIWIILAAVFILAAAIIFIFSDQILPASISDRLHNFDFQQNSVQERFYFWKDALKIIKDHPVFGVGGGGWNAAYRQYQGYLYHSTEVHNHPLQVWAETGTIGFVFFILLWLSGIIAAIRLLLSSVSTEYKALAWTAFCTGAALALHSLMDFSLSEGAVSILLWSQLGLIRSVERINRKEGTVTREFKPIARKVIGGVVGIVFFISSMILFIGDRYAIEAALALQSGNIQEGRANLESALKFDPINAGLRVQLAQVYSYEASQSNNFYLANMAYTEAQKATELHSTNTEFHWTAAQTAAALQKPEEMVRHAEEAVKLAPLVTANYENLAMIYLNAGKIYLNKQQPDMAGIYLEKVSKVPDDMARVWSSKNDTEKRLWKGPPLEPSQKLQDLMKEAEELLAKN